MAETTTREVEGTARLNLAIAVLIHRSAWFEVLPLPEDYWRIRFKIGKMHGFAVDDAILWEFSSHIAEDER